MREFPHAPKAHKAGRSEVNSTLMYAFYFVGHFRISNCNILTFFIRFDSTLAHLKDFCSSAKRLLALAFRA